jgi:hypothetical protein
VNPPFRDPTEAPEAPRGHLPPREPEPPVVVAVDDPAPVEAPEPRAEPADEPSGRPAPVHVPYAKTGSDPDVVSAPAARPVPRRPARSPFWAAVRSHIWLVVIVLVLAGAAGTAYWALRVHQRIDAATLERGIGGRENASAVRCVEQQSNGAVWACGLVYRAASVCLIANVNPVGDWTTNEGPGLCTNRPELTAILPDRITAAAVSADMASQQIMPGARCARVPDTTVRWACEGPSGSGSCLVVRVAPWNALGNPEQRPACEHIPALKKRRGSSS